MRNRFSFFLTLSLLTLLLTQCGLLRRGGGKGDEKKLEGDLVIGSIEMVNPEQKFVLVRTNAPLIVPAGTKLFTYSPSGLKATLKVSPERKLSLLSADIEDGYPQQGLPVFMTLENAQAHAAAAAAASGQPGATDSGTAPPPDSSLHWGGLPSQQPQAAPAGAGDTLHWGGPPTSGGEPPSAPVPTQSDVP